MSVRSVARAIPCGRRLLASLCLLGLLAACQTPDAPAAPPMEATARSVEDAGAFEAWLAPRLGAAQLLVEASRDGLDLMAEIMRARKPGSGVAPPTVTPVAERLERATAASRERLAGRQPFVGGDDEQAMLARDAELHLTQMLASLESFARDLPRLERVARALGPLGTADGLALSKGLARLLSVQARADSVFADLVIGLLTPDSALLPERELQIVRRLGNETLLDSLRQFEDYDHAGETARMRQAEAAFAITRQRQGLAAAARKLERLREAGDDLPAGARGPFADVLRSYDEGVSAEHDFLDALARFSLLVYAVDRDAPDAAASLLAAFDGARRLTERVAARMQTSIERLRTLSDLGRGRRA